jgi:hypothetical protein
MEASVIRWEEPGMEFFAVVGVNFICSSLLMDPNQVCEGYIIKGGDVPWCED